MPALVNIKVGSLRGTSGDDGTISWPFWAKKFRKVDLISLTPLMFIQSLGLPAPGRKIPVSGGNAFRQCVSRCPEMVQMDQGFAAPAQQRVTTAVDNAAAALTALGRPWFLAACSRMSRRERSASMPAPKEQPPRKLSGKRTA